MRSLVIELVTEAIKPGLLRPQRVRVRPCGLGLEGSMHALMSPVLLRLARFNELRDAERLTESGVFATMAHAL